MWKHKAQVVQKGFRTHSIQCHVKTHKINKLSKESLSSQKLDVLKVEMKSIPEVELARMLSRQIGFR